MSKSIYKYTLDVGTTELELPADAQVLSVDSQYGALYLWALVDTPEGLTETRTFDVYGTGHEVPDDPGLHLGTINTGGLVWHVFEDILENYKHVPWTSDAG